MKRKAALAAFALAAAFALGYATSSAFRPRAERQAAASARPFLDEAGEINAKHAARLEAEAKRLDGPALAEACRAWRKHHEEAMRDCYRRHGRELPPYLRD